MDGWMELLILKVFSNLDDSMILWNGNPRRNGNHGLNQPGRTGSQGATSTAAVGWLEKRLSLPFQGTTLPKSLWATTTPLQYPGLTNVFQRPQPNTSSLSLLSLLTPSISLQAPLPASWLFTGSGHNSSTQHQDMRKPLCSLAREGGGRGRDRTEEPKPTSTGSNHNLAKSN